MVGFQRLMAVLLAFAPATAWAAVAPESEDGPPLALIIALVAVAISLGTVFIAARSNKKKD